MKAFATLAPAITEIDILVAMLSNFGPGVLANFGPPPSLNVRSL